MDYKDVTGDHAENINTVKTRGHEKKSARDALPKKTQELLDMEIRRYDGRSSLEAEKWLKAIDDWIARHEIRRTEAFDFLLSDEASTLWKNVKTNQTTDQEAKEWFIETFTIKKTFTDKIKELAVIRQDEDERFATFEIRVQKLVEELMNSKMSTQEIVSEVITNRVRDKRLKEALTTRPEMTQKERNDLAKIYEKAENEESDEDVIAMKQVSYAEAAKSRPIIQSNNQSSTRTDRNVNQRDQRQYEYPVEQRRYERPIETRRYDQPAIRRRYEQPIEQSRRYEQQGEQRRTPTMSLKHIAKKLYNRQKGLPEPNGGELRSGQCFCCGELGHRRFECPLKDKCLICGKGDHRFRDCHLLGSRQKYFPEQKRIACIHEDYEDSQREDNDAAEDYNDVEMKHEVRRRKNSQDSIVHISSMESRL